MWKPIRRGENASGRCVRPARSLLPDGSSFVMPQHWLNVFIGLILIFAVVGDIWLRQNHILGRWFGRLAGRRDATEERA